MTKIIALAKITSKHQITIPKDIMQLLKLKSGDKLLFQQQNNTILISKA